MSMKNSKLKRALMSLIMEFNNLMTDKANLYWNEDTDIQEGYSVFVDGEGDEKIPAPDGEYTSEDKVIVVENGIVKEIKPVEMPAEDPAPAAEPEMPVEPEPVQTAEEPAPVAEPEMPVEPAPVVVVEDDEDMKIKELEDRVAKLEADLASLIEKVAEIATAPAAAPAEEEFEAIVKTQKTGNVRLDRAMAIASAFKK